MVEVARLLRQRLGAAASKVSTLEIPNTIVRLGAAANPAMRALVPFLGRNLNATSEKAIRLLGWSPRSREEAIIAAAESLIEHGLLDD